MFYSTTPFYSKEKDGWHIWNPEWGGECFGPFKTREEARKFARKKGLVRPKKGKVKAA
jgi:hypothetical protein